MTNQYAGKCVYGPYNEQEYVHYSKIMKVVWLEGNLLTKIPFKREGQYEWKDGIWLWNGPVYKEHSNVRHG